MTDSGTVAATEHQPFICSQNTCGPASAIVTTATYFNLDHARHFSLQLGLVQVDGHSNLQVPAAANHAP